MLYLIRHDSPRPEAERSVWLRSELAALMADKQSRSAWTRETGLTSDELLEQLTPFLEAGDSLSVLDITRRRAQPVAS